MNVKTLLQVLAVLWSIVSVYIGVLGLFIAMISTLSISKPALELSSWRRILANVILVSSGVLALSWVFDSHHAWEYLIGFAVFLGVVVLPFGSVLTVYRILNPQMRGRVDAILATWWPRIRIPVRLALAASAGSGASLERDAGVRLALFMFAGLQIILVVCELWLRWRFRDR
jgi:hypothetical protein